MAFDTQKPVGAKHGGTVGIIADNLDLGNGKTIAALHVTPNGERHAYFHYPDGRRVAGDYFGDQFDLVNIPQKRSGWVNCYRSSGSTGFLCGWKTYPTQKDAEAGIDRDGEEWLCAVHITFEEKEGL